MEYGVLNHNNDSSIFFTDKNKEIVNLGDYVQSYGVEYGYLEAGIDKCDIRLIEKYALQDYSGKPMIVTLNNFYGGSGVQGLLNCFPLSSNILPLFIGFSCHDEDVIFSNSEYFRKWEPIGCRDERTKQIFEKAGIPAFLSGCSSILLPQREKSATQNTVFFVDIPESILDYIPDEYKINAKFISQNIKAKNYKNANQFTYYTMAKEYMQMYKNMAKLVVTTKLHCVVPCLAMGIPVILALENIDYRFSWIEKLIPIYDDWKTIDWSIHEYDVSMAKELLSRVYKSRIQQILNNNANYYADDSIEAIDQFYRNRNRCEYNKNIVKMIANSLSNIQYKNPDILIWGAGRTGKLFYEIIRSNFSDVNIAAFVDKYKTGKVDDIDIIKPDDIKIGEFHYAFLCSLPGKTEALSKMRDLGLVQGRNFEEIYFENPILGG